MNGENKKNLVVRFNFSSIWIYKSHVFDDEHGVDKWNKENYLTVSYELIIFYPKSGPLEDTLESSMQWLKSHGSRPACDLNNWNGLSLRFTALIHFGLDGNYFFIFIFISSESNVKLCI